MYRLYIGIRDLSLLGPWINRRYSVFVQYAKTITINASSVDIHG
jgi:hypothetical protein